MTESYPAKPLVIIPTYNERDNIEQLIPAILSLDERLQILIVDDKSPDKTAEAILQLKETRYPNRLFLKSRPGKLGLGSAYIDGFNWGLANEYDFLIEMDADWSHSPEYLAKMLELAAKADFVIGSRYVAGGGTINWGIGRQFLSRFGSFYSRLVLGAHIADFTGGFNGWSSGVLSGIGIHTLRSNGYSFQIELKYRAYRLGFKYIEFPILFNERRAGKSKMSLAITAEAFWRAWQLRLAKKIPAAKISESEPAKNAIL
jgi:dolichol-phosphate mannosyltransferase